MVTYVTQSLPFHYLVRNYIWQQNSRSLWLYYTPNDSFTASNALFYKNKVLCHDLQAATVHTIASTFMLQCLSNYSGHSKYMYASIKINKKYILLYFLISLASMHVLVQCNEFAVMQLKKQQKLGVKIVSKN